MFQNHLVKKLGVVSLQLGIYTEYFLWVLRLKVLDFCSCAVKDQDREVLICVAGIVLSSSAVPDVTGIVPIALFCFECPLYCC